ncbi:MAG: CDP-alcohol phosphatidyltransferase family protein [Cellvibrionaceae bacterium]|nr:CDP-alcohol phosphatidyltransferase family protein [Cellvibrionaceae bacterium]
MRLQRELQFIGAWSAGVLGAGALFLAFLQSGVSPVLWFFLAGALWIYCWLQTWWRRDLNRLEMTIPCYSDFGWANRLTLLRGGLIALTGGFLFQSPIGVAAWMPGILYSIAAVLDRTDGWVARRSGRTSLLGRELDTEMDALGLLVAPLLAVTLGKFHWSFLAVSAAYYIFIGGLHWRRRRQLSVYPLPPSVLRRTLAGLQMGFVAFVLFPVFPAEVTRVLGVAFMIPILAGFLVDWLAVSGRLKNESAFFPCTGYFGQQFFIPALRICVGLLIVGGIIWGELSTLMLLLGILIVAGAGARTASAAFLLVSTLTWTSLSAGNIALLLLCSWITLLGGGAICFWRGDDVWVGRQN